MSEKNQDKMINLKLKIWKQKGPQETGGFIDFEAKDISIEMSFLEMLDGVNNQLILSGQEPIEFDHDCREGICGACSLVINGQPHGPDKGTTTCQLHMRRFSDGETLYVEPFRAKAFPIVKDLVVDRSAFDRVIQAGGYVSVNTGQAPEANSILVPKEQADLAFMAAECIGCGACVASCKNGSGSLFVSAKIAHLKRLPQGQTEASSRAIKMVAQMDEEMFGACSNTGACEASCPKGISLENIAVMNREYRKAFFTARNLNSLEEQDK